MLPNPTPRRRSPPVSPTKGPLPSLRPPQAQHNVRRNITARLRGAGRGPADGPPCRASASARKLRRTSSGRVRLRTPGIGRVSLARPQGGAEGAVYAYAPSATTPRTGQDHASDSGPTASAVASERRRMRDTVPAQRPAPKEIGGAARRRAAGGKAPQMKGGQFSPMARGCG